MITLHLKIKQYPTWRGGELGVLRVREHPLSIQVHPFTTKSTPSKSTENLTKHHFKPISNKFIVVLTFIFGLYLSKTDVIYRSALNSTVISGKAPPRVPTILHLCPTLPYHSLPYPTLPYHTLHYTLHCSTLHYTIIYYTAHYTALHHITLQRWTTLQNNILPYPTLPTHSLPTGRWKPSAVPKDMP